MSILHNVYQGFSSAVNLVVEKNRKNNLINRIKYVIREEETKANQAYIALGKYYFNHCQDGPEPPIFFLHTPCSFHRKLAKIPFRNGIFHDCFFICAEFFFPIGSITSFEARCGISRAPDRALPRVFLSVFSASIFSR